MSERAICLPWPVGSTSDVLVSLFVSASSSNVRKPPRKCPQSLRSLRCHRTTKMASLNERVRHARTACSPCRTSKRRCDRALPTCGLCIRREIDCRYPSRQGRDHADDASSSGSTPATHTRESNSSGDPTSSHGGLALAASSANLLHIAKAVYFIAPVLHVLHVAASQVPRYSPRACFADSLPA